MAKEILFGIPRHLGPIHTAHIFAPTQDLAYKALDRSQGGMASVISRLRPGDDFARIKHFHVQRERQQGMKQAPRLDAHRILEVAKMRQGPFDEGVELLQRLIPVQRPRQPVGTRRAEALHAGPDDAFP